MYINWPNRYPLKRSKHNNYKKVIVYYVKYAAKLLVSFLTKDSIQIRFFIQCFISKI